jgi:tripartite-type tricarboxylate transporter receptor subunit TctC
MVAMKRIFSFSAMALAVLLAVVPSAVSAQPSSRPVRLIVPFPAGGPSDAAARLLGQALTASTGQPVVVDNRPGAGGAIAAQAVLEAPPDGHTLLWGVASMAALPLLQKTPPFQSLSELAPVSLIGRFTYALVVHPGVPAKSVAELVKYARANPGKLAYATGSLGEFMTTAMFMKATGTDLARVPYKGGAQAMPDLLAGRVQVYFTPIQLGLPHARDGKLRLLATVLPQRSPSAPEIPTLAEAGVQGVSTPTWQAVFAPPKTPRDIIGRLSGNIIEALRNPELRSRLEQQAFQVEASRPEALAAVIVEDFASWQTFVRENDIPQE